VVYVNIPEEIQIEYSGEKIAICYILCEYVSIFGIVMNMFTRYYYK